MYVCIFSQVSMAADADASIALPFTPRPLNLNGELVGDVGFDPLNFSEEVSDPTQPTGQI